MAVTFAGFNGSVNQVAFSKMMDLASDPGGTGLSVTAVATARTVSVDTGRVWASGVHAENDAPLSIQLPENLSGNPRKDRIIARFDWQNAGARAITFKEGTPAANPQPPALKKIVGVLWEEEIAEVDVAAGQGTLLEGDITRTLSPPTSGVYYVPSLLTRPTHIGAIYYYTALDELRIVVGPNNEYELIGGVAPQPVFAGTGAEVEFSGITPSVGSPSCVAVFTAPASGKVMVHAGGSIGIAAGATGASAWLGYQVRAGSSTGSGSIVLDATTERALRAGAASSTQGAFAAGSAPARLVTGLTPHATYNAHTRHWRTPDSGSGGLVFSRSILVVPVPGPPPPGVVAF